MIKDETIKKNKGNVENLAPEGANNMKDNMARQYREIAEAIESEGLGYALHGGGYITPDTDDEVLNKAIRQAIEGLEAIDRIIEPYKI